MTTAVGLVTLAFMGFLALRANAQFAAHDHLPMQFGFDGQPTWHASRTIALSFMPVLTFLVFVMLALFAPDPVAVLISAVSMLAGQVFYHYLVARSL